METQLLDWSIRAAIMVAGTAAALAALRVRVAATRHIAWTGVLVAMLLLPIFSVWGPRVTVPVLPAAREQRPQELPYQEGTTMRPASQGVSAPPTLPAQEDKRSSNTYAARHSREAEPPRPMWSWWWIALACYFTGFGAMAIRLVAGTIQARKMVRQAAFINGVGGGGVLLTAQCEAPVTVGWLRPVVVLPEGGPEDWRSWPKAKLDAVLIHEREHVRRRDPLVQWLALLNRAIFWFHPLAWWLERKLSDLAEEACDAAVLKRGHAPVDYSQYLIELARSVERAGARVRVWGTAIDGSSLSSRIRRILDSRPLPSISRTRSSTAAALCLSVLAASSACKPERPPVLAQGQPSSGQPSMNELMHRRAAESQTFEKQRQAIMDDVRKLTPDQAQALEADLKTNPHDREKLIRVVRYYQYRLGGQGFSAITLWYIEHEPAFPWAWNINPEWDREGYEQGKKLWLAHLKKPGIEAAIYRNAAAFLEGGDKPLAEQVLLDGQKSHPNERWDMELGMHYAQALLGSVGPKAEYNVIRAVSMKEAHGEYAQSVRTKLAASNDPQILKQTAQWLMRWGGHFLYSKENSLDFDPLALARSYNDRVLTMQADDPAAISLKLHLEEMASRLRLRNTPPEQINQSDRLRQLRDQMEHGFWRKTADEVESDARELLALAAQNANDPEYGNAIFFANLMLGDVVLRRGDKRQAASHLLAASEAPPTDRLRYGNVDMTLARQLVDWGEREAVAQYLERCAKFNRRGKDLAEWAAQIRKGINPELTPYRSSGPRQ